MPALGSERTVHTRFAKSDLSSEFRICFTFSRTSWSLRPNLTPRSFAFLMPSICRSCHRKDGTAKLLLGVNGTPPKLGMLKQIRIAADEVLRIKIVDHPCRDEPAEAIEV